MSLKGFKKTLVRAPQTFRQKMNMGEVTTDAVYQDAERRFKELENETKKLSSESKRYFSAVNGMLDYQIDFSTAIEEIYKPISGRLSDPNGAVPEDNPEGIKASEQYREVVKELKESLKPDLELIEKRIVNPAQELLQVIQLIRKMATKREHKQVDLDRCKRNYTKYEEKKERTAKDEERMYTAQADLDVAQQEYDYYNDMLKAELPIMFQMQSDFIKPLFVSFYYMQLNIFYTLYSRMEEMKIPYFDLTTDIVEAYVLKKGNIEEQCDSISVTNFKVGRAKQRLDATKRRHAGLAADGTGAPGDQLPTYTPAQYGQYGQQPPAAGAYGQPPAAAYGQPPAAAYGQPPAAAYGQPPAAAYGQPPAAAYGQPPAQYGDYKNPQGPGYQAPAPAAAPTYGSPIASPVATGYAAPAPVAAAPTAQYALPTPAPSAGAQTCTALYDYTAQAQGDLTFAAGAVIEVVEKTVDTNGWWTGKYNGQTGVFPGNYVQLN